MDQEEIDKKKAEVVRDKLTEKARKDANKVNFTVYDLPIEVKNQIISMAKLYYENDASKVVEDAIHSLKYDRTTRIDKLEQKVAQIEAKLEITKDLVDEQASQNYDDSSKNESYPTFGEQQY